MGAPFTGLLSDRLGRRPLIVLALAGVGLATVAAAFANSFATLLAARFAAGVFGAFRTRQLDGRGRRSVSAAAARHGDGLAERRLRPGGRGGRAGGRASSAACSAGAGRSPSPASSCSAWRSPCSSRFRRRGRRTPASSLRQTYSAVLGVPRLGNVLGANLLERSIFNAAVLYLPPFLMLQYALSAAEVAPALALVAIGTIVGTTLGGWLGDRFSESADLRRRAVQSPARSGWCCLALRPGLVISVLLGGLFGLSNATSRPAFLALGSELSPRYRGALLGLLSLTNQGGAVFGSALGGLAISLGSYGSAGGD